MLSAHCLLPGPTATFSGPQIHDRQQSADGYELNFATNTLGSFALTLAMEPLLKQSTPAKARCCITTLTVYYCTDILLAAALFFSTGRMSFVARLNNEL